MEIYFSSERICHLDMNQFSISWELDGIPDSQTRHNRGHMRVVSGAQINGTSGGLEFLKLSLAGR